MAPCPSTSHFPSPHPLPPRQKELLTSPPPSPPPTAMHSHVSKPHIAMSFTIQLLRQSIKTLSFPSGLIEYQRVELGPINFILFAIFLGILAAIALGMVVIVLKRKNIAKKEDLLEEERKSKMFAVRIEANGNMPNGNEKTHSAGQMNKRTSANNGEAKGGNNTQVICLEPALDEDEKKMSSMTPV